MLKLFKKSSLKTIDKEALESEISSFKSMGVSGDDDGIIVSLTSFPQRMYELHYALYSLLTQSVKPSKVILWLAKEEFPHLEADLPEQVLKFKNNGLQIEWCNNIYSYKKLVPTLKKYPNNVIVTCDDDVFYEHNWLEILLNAHIKNPDCIICHRAHKIKYNDNVILSYRKWVKKVYNKTPSFDNFFTGVGGVLYPPNCFYKDILKEDIFLKLAPKADDIWFWAMAILNKTKISVADNCIKEMIYINPKRERGLIDEITLFASNKNGGNDKQIRQILNYYPALFEMLKS